MTDALEHPAIGGLTLHLTPVTVWQRQVDGEQYVPDAYDTDGFIHCTDGEANLIEVANRYYRADPRPYAVLIIDLTKVVAPVRYEDAARIYPHIYGPLNPDAVVAVHQAERDDDGTFIGVI